MKIIIDNPCHENWNAMAPNKDGAHCFSCQKSVIDFSQKSINEIKSFFNSITNSEKICGRFKQNQLKELSFDDFFMKFKKWILPHKLVVIMLFTFGLTLFSCQSNPPKTEIMGGVVAKNMKPDTTKEVDKIQNQNLILGEAAVIDQSVKQKQSKQIIVREGSKYLKGDVAFINDTLKKKVCTTKDSINKSEDLMIMGGLKKME